MTSKLSFHLSNIPDERFYSLIEQMQPPLVKLLDVSSEMVVDRIRRIAPGTLIVYRKYTNLDYHSPADAFVAELDDTLNKLSGRGVIWEGLSEPIISSAEEAEVLNAWYVRFAQLMHQRGERIAAFSFSTGNPSLELVPRLAAAAKEADYIALNEYIGYQVITHQILTSNLMRCRDFLAQLSVEARKPVIIAECGLDDNEGHGWNGYIDINQYIALLASYDFQLMADPAVIGATIYEYGAGTEWATFDIAPVSQAIANYVVSAAPPPTTLPPISPPIITPPPEPIPPPIVIEPPPVITPPPIIVDGTQSADPRLAAYPRPENDNGLGIHWGDDLRGPGTLPNGEPSAIDRYMPLVETMHLKWLLIYSQSGEQTYRMAKACKARGIMPVIRPNAVLNKFMDWDQHVHGAQDAGFPNPYIQLYNEAADVREWPGESVPLDATSQWIDKWSAAAQRVLELGGLPGVQCLDPGELSALIHRADKSIWTRAWFCPHSYGLNHPPNYPIGDAQLSDEEIIKAILKDDITVLNYIEFADVFEREVGFVPPFIVGEGGFPIGAEDDHSMPKVTPEMNKAWQLEWFDWFKRGSNSLGKPLQDYYFAVCPWVLFGYWWQWSGGVADYSWTIEAIKAIPPYERQFSGAVAPPPAVNPCAESTQVYQSMSVTPITDPANDLPLGWMKTPESSPDVDLRLRGWTEVAEAPEVIERYLPPETLDPKMPPQISSLYGGTLPKIVKTYRVYGWDFESHKSKVPEFADNVFKVNMIGLAAAPGQSLYGLKAERQIGGGNVFMVLYANEHDILFTHSPQDALNTGYLFYFLDICIDPNLLARYRSDHSAGRNQLPVIAPGQIFGYATDQDVKVVVRDTMSMVDPRFREDWWEYGKLPPVPPPTPSETFIDPRAYWLRVENGTEWKVETVWWYSYRHDSPKDSESQDISKIRVATFNKDGSIAVHQKVTLGWPPSSDSPESFNDRWTGIQSVGEVEFDMGTGAYFDPKKTVGPYTITCGGASVRGIGLAGLEHQSYVIVFRKKQ